MSPSLLLGQPALTPQGCIVLCLPNKTELYQSCNSGPPFQTLLQQDRTKEITHSPDICHDSDLTRLKQPQLSPCKAETKHSRSPTQQKSHTAQSQIPEYFQLR